MYIFSIAYRSMLINIVKLFLGEILLSHRSYPFYYRDIILTYVTPVKTQANVELGGGWAVTKRKRRSSLPGPSTTGFVDRKVSEYYHRPALLKEPATSTQL